MSPPPDVNFCPSCGRPISAGSRHCVRCANLLRSPRAAGRAAEAAKAAPTKLAARTVTLRQRWPKLSDEQIRLIQEAPADQDLTLLAKRFGMSLAAISAIRAEARRAG